MHVKAVSVKTLEVSQRGLCDRKTEFRSAVCAVTIERVSFYLIQNIEQLIHLRMN